MDLYIDKLADAFYESGTLTRRLVRKAQVHGISTGSTSGYMVRALDTAGLPRLRDRHPEVPDLFLQQRVVRPLAGDAVEIDLVYQPNEVTAVAPNTLVVRTRTALSTEIAESILLPGAKGAAATLEAFQVEAKIGDASTRASARMNRLVPLRQIDVDAISTTEPPENMADAVGCVNDSAWCGKPAGYWMATRVEEARSTELPGTYTLAMSFLTRSIRNWMEWDFTRDRSGRITADDAAKTQAFQLCTQGYRYGITNFNGIIVAGQYLPANFASLFGFSSTKVRKLQLNSTPLFQFGYSYASLPSARGEGNTF